MGRVEQIVFLFNFLYLTLKLLIFLPNRIKFFVLLDKDIVEFLNFFSDDSEVLLVLENF